MSIALTRSDPGSFKNAYTLLHDLWQGGGGFSGRVVTINDITAEQMDITIAHEKETGQDLNSVNDILTATRCPD